MIKYSSKSTGLYWMPVVQFSKRLLITTPVPTLWFIWEKFNTKKWSQYILQFMYLGEGKLSHQISDDQIKFKKISTRNNHSRTQSNDVPTDCPECGAIFCRKSVLLRHFRSKHKGSNWNWIVLPQIQHNDILTLHWHLKVRPCQDHLNSVSD